MLLAREDSVDDSSSNGWSDPRDLSTSSSTHGEDKGIAIPSFLQPLLGLDFVPYLPDEETPDSPKRVPTGNTNKNLDDMDVLNLTPVVTNRVPRPSSEPDLLSEGLKPPSSRQTSQERIAKSNRKLRQPRGTFIRKMRGKMEGRRDRLRQRSDTWHAQDENMASEKSHAGGRSNSQEKDAFQWVQEQSLQLQEHRMSLSAIQAEAQEMKSRASTIQLRVAETEKEIMKLQKVMKEAETRLRRDIEDFDQTQQRLFQLQQNALLSSQALVESLKQMQDLEATPPQSTSSSRSSLTLNDFNNDPTNDSSFAVHPVSPPSLDHRPLRPRASTAPSAIRSDSFMRVDDLDILDDGDGFETSCLTSDDTEKQLAILKPNGFIFLDHHISNILKKLSKLGYRIAVDESDRFLATKDTEKLLKKYATTESCEVSLNEWPLQPWHAARGNDILVWTGSIGHSGFGCEWPVVKARCLVETSPRNLIEYMMDSSKVKEYNKMSQGREEILIIQEGLETSEFESPYGFAGECKIARALNKPRLLPKTIESLSLMYAKPLEAGTGCYMIVSRSVFEDDSGEHKSPTDNAIRTEMLLGVLLFRPVNAEHTMTELTSITHMFSPGVPEMLARRAAPGSAYNVLKEIQRVFAKRQ